MANTVECSIRDRSIVKCQCPWELEECITVLSCADRSPQQARHPVSESQAAVLHSEPSSDPPAKPPKTFNLLRLAHGLHCKHQAAQLFLPATPRVITPEPESGQGLWGGIEPKGEKKYRDPSSSLAPRSLRCFKANPLLAPVVSPHHPLHLLQPEPCTQSRACRSQAKVQRALCGLLGSPLHIRLSSQEL